MLRNHRVGKTFNVAGRPAITHADLNQDVLGSLLGIFDEDIEVAVVVEDARIHQFVLHVAAAARLVGSDEVIVRKCRLRVFVQVLHV